MSNLNQYREGLTLCNQAKEKSNKIALAILQDEYRAIDIVSAAFKKYLEQCYYEGVPEGKELAIYEIVYAMSLEAKTSELQDTSEDIQNQNVKTEGVEDDAAKVSSSETKEEIIEGEDTSFEICDDEEEITESLEEQSKNLTSDSMYFSPFEEENEEIELSPEEEREVDNVSAKPEFQEGDVLVSKDRFSQIFQEETEENVLENENTEENIETPVKTTKKKSTKIILICIYVILGLLLLWLFFGLMINTGHIKPIDLGYSWFNEHIFRAFYL